MKSIITLLTIFLSNLSFACTCSNINSVKAAWIGAEQVFIGKVIEVDTVGKFYTKNGNRYPTYTIQILESFKKEIDSTKNLRSFIFRGSGSCDFKFKQNEVYLIFAEAEPQDMIYSASICSKTNFLSNISNEDIQELKILKNQYQSFTKENKDEFLLDDNNNFEQVYVSELLQKEKYLIFSTSILGSLVIILVCTLIIKTKH